MLQLQSPSIPGTYSTKIWMSTELAENQDLGPLGYPHHHGVLGFWRIFYTNLKIAQGLRGGGCEERAKSDLYRPGFVESSDH